MRFSHLLPALALVALGAAQENVEEPTEDVEVEVEAKRFIIEFASVGPPPFP